MKVNGNHCLIVIKTSHRELNVPYSEETIREAVSILQEEAAIEGDGSCKAVVKKIGVTGCIVTPLTIGSVPLLMYLAFGSAGVPVYVSETRNIYQYRLNLLPMEEADNFDLIQDRGFERKLFEYCRVRDFELLIERDKYIKLKLDIYGRVASYAHFYSEPFDRVKGDLFKGNSVDYKINGKRYYNIYGLTFISKKENGTKSEVWIKRTLHADFELPENIEEIVISAKLQKDKYEYNRFGLFRITLKNLVLVSDETTVNTSDTVIGPIRYYVSGSVATEVFTSGNERCW